MEANRIPTNLLELSMHDGTVNTYLTLHRLEKLPYTEMLEKLVAQLVVEKKNYFDQLLSYANIYGTPNRVKP